MLGMGNRAVLLGIATVALSACSSASGSNQSGPEMAQANAVQVPASAISAQSLGAAVTANNAFALDLYAHVSAASPTSNLLTSPFSASLVLTMAYAGAQGQTATEMATALHFGAGAGQAVFDGQDALSQAVASRGQGAFAAAQSSPQAPGQPGPSASDYDLDVVNSVWGERTVSWAEPFLKTLATSYGAGVHLQDFMREPDQARLTINAWVSSETHDKISDLLPPASIDNSTLIVLVNAIHLKFPWDTPFDPSATVPGTFTRPDGTTVSPSFMNLQTSLLYVDDGQAQIVSLPLSNGQVSVVIALPHAGVDLATYEASLNGTSAAIALPQATAMVSLSLPKVTFTSNTFSLKTSLEAMGMVQAFTPDQADFSGMGPAPLYLSDVLQKAMVSMQETGVEAAAATAAIGEGTAAFVGTPASMIVNRPYLVSIVDATGAVLFLGHIVDPTAGGQ